MKKILFISVAVVMLMAIAYANTYNLVRVNGTSTNSAGEFYLYANKADTVSVDTAVSDIIDLGDFKYLSYKFSLTGYTLADSANDSVGVTFKIMASYDGIRPTAILSDTLSHTGALDSTLWESGTIKIDSLLAHYNQFYVLTIISDSVVTNIAADSSAFRFLYHTFQSEYKQR